MSLDRLNYHHLHYFWAVATDGNLSRTARALHVSQSALSAQIKQLEAQLGEALFTREGRGLVLTEAGRIALRYADEIFERGRELVATFEGGRDAGVPLRVGAVATLSRNFQESFLDPILRAPEVTLRLRSGALEDLLERLQSHALDVVLSNRPPREPATFRSRLLARQAVSIVGPEPHAKFQFPRDVRGASMILPGPDSDIRTAFDALCGQLGVEVHALAEVDDMATMRLLARDGRALALVPSVVVRDELSSGALYEHCVVPNLYETFFAITVERLYPHPWLRPLLARSEEELLGRQAPEHQSP
ncbi:MAG: LysR family transcriptional regulator [Sandaracinus sp.]|nr:LysR family transcriptional regulator [Sandaracinus sp.]MCB9613089.1 LysR family transcriptional regulator [Sandaracinus sp.]MCB9624638.1 LysR family transcriptional regulator [Sandaracinus sp.]MCB9632781.1 LysR family transcriptional regulator [Sandaracinus sp.]